MKFATNAKPRIPDVRHGVSNIVSRPVVPEAQGGLTGTRTNAFDIHRDAPEDKENGVDRNRPVSTTIGLSFTEWPLTTA